MEVEDVGSVGLKELGQATEAMVAAGNGQTILRALNTTFSASVPQLYLNIDREQSEIAGSTSQPGLQHSANLLGLDVRQ